MRRAVLALCAACAVCFLAGAGQIAPPRLVEFSAQGRADLDRISAYLNGIGTLESGFVQIGPNGELDQGRFYLAKPGRMRFEYDPPNPTLIVVANGTVTVKNARLDTVDHYSLSDTPLGLILDKDIDLKTNRAILGIDEENGAFVVHARTSASRTQSNVTLVFAAPDIELRQWTVKDNQGLITTVALRGIQSGIALPDALFVAPVKNPPAARK